MNLIKGALYTTNDPFVGTVNIKTHLKYGTMFMSGPTPLIYITPNKINKRLFIFFHMRKNIFINLFEDSEITQIKPLVLSND